MQPPASLVSRVEVPGSVNGLGVSVAASGSSTTPWSSAAAAVTTLNVEPGGYVWRSARFSIGRSAAAFSRAQALLLAVLLPDSSPGSYEGVLTSARIFPVAGSTAATAPFLPPSPSYAARCTDGAMVVTTSPAGCCSRVSAVHSGTGASRASVPERMASSAFSRSEVP